MTVNEITSESRIAIESVTANSWNNKPTMPGISRIGMNTAISERLMEITVKLTSALPSSAASRTSIPASMWRTTFSSTTTASSTTKPVAMVSAISERLSTLYPSRYIGPKVPRMASGSTTAGIRVARGDCRNTNTTPITSTTAKNRLRSVSPTAAVTDCERSSAM